MWPTPRWRRSPGPWGWPRARSRPSSTGAATHWPPAWPLPGRTTMSEERLRRAAGALERSVAEVDVLERLEALGRRRRRQRSTTVLAVLVAVAVFGGAALGLPALPATHP